MADIPSGLIRRSNQMLFDQETAEELQNLVTEAAPGEDAADALIELGLPALTEMTDEDQMLLGEGAGLYLGSLKDVLGEGADDATGGTDSDCDCGEDDCESCGDEVEITPEEEAELLAMASDDTEDKGDDDLFTEDVIYFNPGEDLIV